MAVHALPMKPFAVLTTAVGLAAGTVAGTAAYLVVAGPGPASTTVPVSEHVSTVVPGTRFEWAPCRGSATLEHGVCVTDVVRTVTVPGPASSAPDTTDDPSTSGDDQDELEPDESLEPDDSAEPEEEAEPDEYASDDDAYEHDGSGDHEAEDPEVEHAGGGLDD